MLRGKMPEPKPTGNQLKVVRVRPEPPRDLFGFCPNCKRMAPVTKTQGIRFRCHHCGAVR